MWIFRRKTEHLSPEMLSEYVDQRLSREEVMQVERHLEICGTCAEEIESLRYAVGLLQRVTMRAPSRIFTIAEAPVTAPTPRRLMAPAWAYGAVASLAAILFAVVVSADLSGSLAGGATRIPDAIERESVAEVPVEVAKEVQVEAILEKETVVEKEVIKQVPVEVAKEVQIEAILDKETAVEKEVIKQVPVEVAKEVPAEVILEKETAVEKEVIKQVPVEVAKEVQAEAILEKETAEKEVIKQVPVEVAKEVQVEAILESAVGVAPRAVEKAAAAPVPTSAPQIAAAEDAAAPVAAIAVEEPEPEIAAAEDEIVEENLSLPTEAPTALEAELEQIEAVAPVATLETLAEEPTEAVKGSTSPLWHVLEGVLGGTALLLAGIIVWQVRRRRTHVAS